MKSPDSKHYQCALEQGTQAYLQHMNCSLVSSEDCCCSRRLSVLNLCTKRFSTRRSSSIPPCDCLCIICPPSSHPSLLPSSPQSHVCAPRFIPGSFWRGVPRRAERGAGQSRRFRGSSDSLPPDQRSSQRLLPQPHGE